MAKLSQSEIEILEKKLKNNWRFQIKLGVIGLSLGTILLFVPLDILSKAKRSGVSGSLIENNGFFKSFLFMACFVGFIWGIMYILNIYKLNKDLRVKEKICARVKIKKIEHLSEKLAREMEGNKDTILHFEKHSVRIKKFYFNKKTHPQYLDAKEMQIEQAKYSKIEFKSEIV